MLTASMLYAKTQGRECQGKEVCHWCGSPCDRRWIHDDEPPVPFVRTRSTAKFPANPWMCVGCWFYHRPLITVTTMSGKMLDRKSLKDFSWVMTEADVKAVEKWDYQKLYDFLLSPPLTFSLSLRIDGGGNLIQLAAVNQNTEILANTVLKYTLDGKEYEYSVYELEEALKHGPEGKSGGVRALLGVLGKCDSVEPVTPFDEEVRGRGRPKKNDSDPRKKIK